MRVALIDTGPLVALFDDADRDYERCKGLLARLLGERVRLVTTWPCVTEASYLLAPANHMALLQWLHAGAVAVQGFDADVLEDMLGWMKRYTEPGRSIMDFADASLYWLAQQLDSPFILTLDVRDFSRYRLPDGRAFEIL
ncbi:PIN domain-containing protein [Ottowia sp.]|uniref:type II toxin-antitoxin system VapC family toxin n=1 Tax=Ottowia sp. TaxID=1898956 RepID=UPI002C1F4520|nr:PIN domain-containing protein [Ottowia sp.]HRN75078.1 PIN domain-containing protein [Ottowia sp.]HRQ03385.1 PIN domain-containing protein [Ottowia sp.]